MNGTDNQFWLSRSGLRTGGRARDARRWITMVGAIGGLLLLARAAIAQTTIFTDNFTPGPSPLWNNLRGDWVATSGVYYTLHPDNDPLTYTALPFNLTDSSLDVDISAVADGGVWLRSDEAGQNGILLVTGGNGWGSGDRGGNAGTSMYWHQVVNGQYSPILNEAYNVITDPGAQSIHLRVQVTGNVYEAFVDGSTIPVTALTDSTYASGRMALYDFSSQTFSNVVVQVLGGRSQGLQGPFGLAITNSGAQQATISWSTNANAFFLESTPSILSPRWSLVTNRPAVSNQQYVVTIPLTDSSRFFRLSLQ